MPDIFLPTLHSFAMNNKFTGSWKELRFCVEPNVAKLNKKEVDFPNSSISVRYWYGPFCMEKSEIKEEKTFPMTEEGRLAIKSWLEEKI